MADEELRELRRSWELRGDVADGVRYLRLRLRHGLASERVERAAWLGDPAAREILSHESDVAWSLRYTDTFDREMPPQVEKRGKGIDDGLLWLWFRTLGESIDADSGSPGFSRFTLSWDTPDLEFASVPVVGQRAPALVRLARLCQPVRLTGDLLQVLVKAHARLLRWREPEAGSGAEAERLLDLLEEGIDPHLFRHALESARSAPP